MARFEDRSSSPAARRVRPPTMSPRFSKRRSDCRCVLISGYKGTADMRVAVESGEVDGLCGFSWVSVRTTWRKAIESGQVSIMLQSAPKAHPDLPESSPDHRLCQDAGGAPAHRSRRASTERDDVRLFAAARHAEGSCADLAPRFYPRRSKIRIFSTMRARRTWKSRPHPARR